MQFKRITLDDMPEISRFLDHQNYKTCDFTCLGIYMWVNYFGYEYAVEDDTLYLRENPGWDGHDMKYLLPLNRDGTTENGICRLLSDDLVKSKGALQLTCVPEQALEEICLRFTAEATLKENRSDYIYDAHDLQTLSGKKYSKKRNLIHQFVSVCDYRLAAITDEDIPRLISFMEKEWEEDDLSEPERYENRHTTDVLLHYDMFDLCGFVLYEDDRVIAFSIGEIQNDVYFVHIEKAMRDCKGAYQAINNFCAVKAAETAPYSLINREDDAGDEGLRQAKSSYFPVKMLHKYDVLIKL